MKKRILGFWEIWNMSFGFLGIQFGFALQGGFMSRIFQTLGADKESLPLLWIAAPLTGLIVQPIIGYLSDKTWHSRLGRRRPYFLIGAILSSLALCMAPHSSALWMAAGFLWILDASINISMEPFRALVADKLHESQRSYGFVVQALIIGVGTLIASNLPWLVTILGVSNEAAPGVVPMSVKVAFGIGAVVFITSILYTIFTTDEYPPEDMQAFEKMRAESKGRFFQDIAENIGKMPSTMVKLGVVQFFSWFAFFTMWSMAMPALTEHVYNAPAPMEVTYDFSDTTQQEKFDIANAKYQDASDKVGSAMGIYGLSSMGFALVLAYISSKFRVNRKFTHMISLIIGGVGFISMYYASSIWHLYGSFLLVGIAWGSILSMPYAMLSSAIDAKKMGVYMGLFNMFIVLPQIVAAIGGINLSYKLLGDQTINAMIVAGVCLLLAALANLLITNRKAIAYTID